MPLIPTTTDYERLRNHDAKLKERMRRQRLLSGEMPTAPRLGEWAVKPNARQRPRTGGPVRLVATSTSEPVRAFPSAAPAAAAALPLL